jgi:hypothetical protein
VKFERLRLPVTRPSLAKPQLVVISRCIVDIAAVLVDHFSTPTCCPVTERALPRIAGFYNILSTVQLGAPIIQSSVKVNLHLMFNKRKAYEVTFAPLCTLGIANPVRTEKVYYKRMNWMALSILFELSVYREHWGLCS